MPTFSLAVFESPANSDLFCFPAAQEKLARPAFPGPCCLPDRPLRSLMERTSAVGTFVGKNTPASSSLCHSPTKSNLLHFRAAQENLERPTFLGPCCIPDRPLRSLMDRTSVVGSITGEKTPPASSSLYRSPAKSNLLHFQIGQEKLISLIFLVIVSRGTRERARARRQGMQERARARDRGWRSRGTRERARGQRLGTRE